MYNLNHLIVNPMVLKAQRMGLSLQRDTSHLRMAGRLAQFVDAWKVLTSDPWVLQAVKGFRMTFAFLYEASRACVSSRAGSSGEGGTPVTAGEGCCSTSYSQPRRFLLEFVPDTQKEWANETSDQPETVEQLGDSGTLQDGMYPHLTDLLQSGDWLVKVDLKDAYFTVPIDSDHQQYLRFMLDREDYQFTCLPFSLSCAPHTFTKVMKPLMTLLRSWGVRLIIYLDKMVILADTAELAAQHLYRCPGVAVTGPGIYCQSGEVGFYADPMKKVKSSISMVPPTQPGCT